MSGFALKDPRRIGVAVLGAGRMAQTHMRTLAGIDGVEVIVVADPVAAAAERGREIAHARRASLDPMEAIHDPDVEVVIVVTPTSTHAELIEAALRAGRAVWTEKPIAQEIADTQRIVDLWRETGLPLAVGFMRRYDPGYARAKELIDAGELGRIEQFHAYSRDVNPPPLEYLLHAGGSFLDMSVHDLDLARFLVGEVEEVHAWAATLFDERFTRANDWDTAAIMLRFRNGAMGMIETARHSTWGYDIRAEVSGSVAKVAIDAGQKTPATFVRRVAAEHDLYGDFFDRFEVAYRRELEVFFEDLAAGRTPQPGPDDALETLRLAVACTRSWRENRPIRLDEVTA
jgi:myo-inositol 2-dehydrogenase / D-chiro-inositol 1-dehydrogenase